MHLLESYSLCAAAKIGSPFILEKFFPLPCQKYIVIQPFSKPSKSYDFWDDVMEEIYPILTSEGYSIVQIGGKNERGIKGCINISGQTTIGQAAYIISNAELVMGADSFGVHLASYYKKKIVALYSNNYLNCVKPFWSNENDFIGLEPPNRDGKPLFSFEEHPKSINTIRSEDIADAVYKLLNLNTRSKYKTVFIGQNYINKFIESIPSQIIDIGGMNIDCLIMRMDKEHNEFILAEQLKRNKCSIVCNKPISIDLIKFLKQNIKEIIYEINPNNIDKQFLSDLQKHNIPNFLITECKNKDLEQIKLNLLDFGNINIKLDFSGEIKKLKENNKNDKLFYKSGKITLKEGRAFQSFSSIRLDQPLVSTRNEYQEIIDQAYDIGNELEHIKIVVEK